MTPGRDAFDCIFCAKVKNKDEADVIFSDDVSMVFLDNHPLFFGHSLVIPKEHFRNMFDVPYDTLCELSKRVKLVSLAVKSAMHSDGVLVITNTEISQNIPHMHIHVIPRKRGDGLRGFMWPRHRYESVEHMVKTRNLIREALGNAIKESGFDPVPK